MFEVRDEVESGLATAIDQDDLEAGWHVCWLMWSRQQGRPACHSKGETNGCE